MAGNDDRLRRGEVVALRRCPRLADIVAVPGHRRARIAFDASRGDRRALDGLAAVETGTRVTFVLVPAELQPVPRPHRPREHPEESYLLSGPTAFDFEDRARDRAIGIAFGRGKQLRDAGDQLFDARTVIADPKKTGCTSAFPVCAANSPRSLSYETSCSSSTYAARKTFVVVGKQIHQTGDKRGVGGSVRA